jgi:hypothetical protein
VYEYLRSCCFNCYAEISYDIRDDTGHDLFHFIVQELFMNVVTQKYEQLPETAPDPYGHTGFIDGNDRLRRSLNANHEKEKEL